MSRLSLYIYPVFVLVFFFLRPPPAPTRALKRLSPLDEMSLSSPPVDASRTADYQSVTFGWTAVISGPKVWSD